MQRLNSHYIQILKLTIQNIHRYWIIKTQRRISKANLQNRFCDIYLALALITAVRDKQGALFWLHLPLMEKKREKAEKDDVKLKQVLPEVVSMHINTRFTQPSVPPLK